ncbi:DNA-methyltransferase [Paraburkholderia sp. 2C]
MSDWIDRCHFGDCRDTMRAMIADGVKAQTIVTSPPYYGLRDYGHPGQLGLEESPDAYIAAMVEVFRAGRDVLADDGTLWLNIGDSYAGSWGAQGRTGQMADRSIISARQIEARPHKASRTGAIPAGSGLKPKDLIGIPWLLAFALRADGWYLRSEIIWSKGNPMPESVADRPTKSHEHLFLLAKSGRYYYDHEAVKEPAVQAGRMRSDRVGGDKYIEGVKHSAGAIFTGSETRNRRTVWDINTQPYSGAHFATFPEALVDPCIRAGSRPGDIVFDPFFGSGTTGQVAWRLGRSFIGCELNRDYEPLQRGRIIQRGLEIA